MLCYLHNAWHIINWYLINSSWICKGILKKKKTVGSRSQKKKSWLMGTVSEARLSDFQPGNPLCTRAGGWPQTPGCQRGGSCPPPRRQPAWPQATGSRKLLWPHPAPLTCVPPRRAMSSPLSRQEDPHPSLHSQERSESALGPTSWSPPSPTPRVIVGSHCPFSFLRGDRSILDFLGS